MPINRKTKYPKLYEKYKFLLYEDLKTDQERIDFFRCGRAWETGIIANSVVPDIIRALERRKEHTENGKLVNRVFRFFKGN